MATLDWHVSGERGVTLVRLLVTSDATERIRVRNRLDGPVWPPRRQGVPAEGWTAKGFEGVVDADERLVLGYASPAEPSEPPASVTVVGPEGEGECAVTPRDVVRALGDPSPPRDAVSSRERTVRSSPEPAPKTGLDAWEWGRTHDREHPERQVATAGRSGGDAHPGSKGRESLTSDGDSTVDTQKREPLECTQEPASEGQTQEREPLERTQERASEERTQERASVKNTRDREPATASKTQQNHGSDWAGERPRAAVEEWLAEVTDRLDAAERLADATSVPEAREAVAAVGDPGDIAELRRQLDEDRDTLRRVVDRSETLASRVETLDLPVETLQRLA